jgi:hypothetical protein
VIDVLADQLNSAYMKRIHYTLLLIVFGIGAAVGCAKQGPAGSTGATGSSGPVGPAGANGTVIYSGTTAPSTSTGNIGDFYLDLATGILYGPKTSSGWGSGISITGTSGAAGSQIYSGSGVPPATLGNNGDYYLDSTNYNLYGPKTASGWGTALSLKGTANVIYSAWNTASNIRDTVIDGSMLSVATLAATELTSAWLNTATVLVYLQFGGGEIPLPYTSDAGGMTSTVSFIPQTGQILITRYTMNDSASIKLIGSIEYRWVIIPGGVSVPN